MDADDRCVEPLTSFVPPDAALAGYQENYGTLGNNVLGAAPGHPVIVRALELAITAVNRGDHDIVWLLTGPGLLTRAAAEVFAGPEGTETLEHAAIFEWWQLQRHVAVHCPVSYKRSRRHWVRAAFRARAPL